MQNKNTTQLSKDQWPQTKWYKNRKPLGCSVFHGLSFGVILFSASVKPRKRSFWQAVEKFQPFKGWFLELTLA